jgi:ribosomal protein S18 acetylase RimI-like enzyme
MPVPAAEVAAAMDLLNECYCADPSFRRLFGMEVLDPRATAPLFQHIAATLAGVPGLILGCYTDGELLGVVAYSPAIPSFDLFLRSPLLFVTSWLRGRLGPRWFDHRMPPDARRRHRAYIRFAFAQQPRGLNLHVSALGVIPEARGQGVARRLLAAMEADPRWAECKLSVVDTWHGNNVAIYERLGFTTHALRTSADASCWTMTRPIARSPWPWVQAPMPGDPDDAAR